MGGGKKGSLAAARTDDLLTIVQTELAALPEGPKLIAVDLNGSTDAFDTIITMLSEEARTDVG